MMLLNVSRGLEAGIGCVCMQVLLEPCNSFERTEVCVYI